MRIMSCGCLYLCIYIIKALQLLHTFQAYKEAAETEMAKKGQEIGSEVSVAIILCYKP